MERRAFVKIVGAVSVVPLIGPPETPQQNTEEIEHNKKIKFRQYSRLSAVPTPLAEGIAPTRSNIMRLYGYK